MKRALILALLALPGCKVGPDYARPAPSSLPPAFKEMEGWKQATPSDTMPRGAWWQIFKDPVLDGLEQQVAVSNQSLRANEAAFRQAVATVAVARSQLFPTLGLTASATRRRGTSGGSSVLSSSTLDTTNLGGANGVGTTGAGTTGVGTGTAGTAGAGTTGVTSSGASTVGGNGSGGGGRANTTYTVQGTASWELDLWGRIRREVEGDVAAAQSSAADLANALLSAQSQLATSYFQLRAADALRALLDRTVADYERAVQIAQNQYNAGTAARADVITAQTQLAGARAQAINVGVQRAQLEHAIAVLIGRAPAELSIAPAPLATDAPLPPAGIPSDLLERRPDIASAERLMAAQNAQVGVAVAAFYPRITLSGLLGLSGDPISQLFNIRNNVWSLGASAAQTLFSGGARGAAVEQARAAYDGAVATYRQTVLTAFQGVEDQLAAARILREQNVFQQDAVQLARRSVAITLNQYRAGTQAYTAVITAQNTALADEQAALTVQQNLLTASVGLVTALGGGWTAADLPPEGRIRGALPVFP